MTLTDIPARGLIPRSYLAWLAGSTISRLGDAVLSFALVWEAAGRSGSTAALVLTFSGLPRLLLLLVGGTVADKVGARRVLITGEATLLVLVSAIALTLAHLGTPTWLLLSSSLALGTVSAFCLPASGSMPRRLVLDDQLTRALALRQSASQAVLMAAAPLGGLLIAGAGLPAIAWGAAAALGLSLCVLVTVCELSGLTTDRGAVRPRPGRSMWGDLLEGFRVVARTPGLREALLLTGAGAALILPITSLLVPLLGRTSSWSAATTGLTSGAVGVGVICAALVVARRPAITPWGRSSPAAGLAVSALGVLMLTFAPFFSHAGPGVAILGGLVSGVGNGLFVARLAPLVLGSAPRTHLARVQAVVGLAQLLPAMVSNIALGGLAERMSPTWALGTAAAGLLSCALWANRRPLGAMPGPDAGALRQTESLPPREEHQEARPA